MQSLYVSRLETLRSIDDMIQSMGGSCLRADASCTDTKPQTSVMLSEPCACAYLVVCLPSGAPPSGAQSMAADACMAATTTYACVLALQLIW